MTTTVEAIREKMRGFIKSMEMTIDEEQGVFMVEVGETLVGVTVFDGEDTGVLVGISALTNFGLDHKSGVFEFVAMEGDFGLVHLECHEDDGKILVSLGTTLRGEHLNLDDYRVTMNCIAQDAPEIAAEIKARFAGRTYDRES